MTRKGRASDVGRREDSDARLPEPLSAMLEAARYGSYFRCLDLPLTAATSEVREAYRARRAQADAFRPLAARSPQVAEALDVVAGVLEDALEVLADPDRRLAYRRAVEAP